MSKRGLPFRQIRTRRDELYGAIVLSGRTHSGVVTSENNATLTLGTINRLVAFPYWVGRTMSVDLIAAEVTTSQVASNLRLGIYGSGGDGLPANLLVESASFDSSTTGIKSTAITLDLPGPRLYWATLITNVTGVVVKGRGKDSSITMGLSNVSANDPGNSGFVTHTFGALPDPYGAFTQQTLELAPGSVGLRIA